MLSNLNSLVVGSLHVVELHTFPKLHQESNSSLAFPEIPSGNTVYEPCVEDSNNDLDIPIVVRKGVRSCTQHPISNRALCNFYPFFICIRNNKHMSCLLRYNHKSFLATTYFPQPLPVICLFSPFSYELLILMHKQFQVPEFLILKCQSFI